MGGQQFTVQSEHGYNMFEVVSALQKAIRRGQEEKAMYWALEFLPKKESYLWRRLLVIASEDIGLASPETLCLVTSQAQAWFMGRKLGGGDELKVILANAILAMCRAPKSRLADEFQTVISSRSVRGPRETIPDEALDIHTWRGKQMGRGIEFFLDVGAQLFPQGSVDNSYTAAARAVWLGGAAQPLEFPAEGKRAQAVSDMLL